MDKVMASNKSGIPLPVRRPFHPRANGFCKAPAGAETNARTTTLTEKRGPHRVVVARVRARGNSGIILTKTWYATIAVRKATEKPTVGRRRMLSKMVAELLLDRRPRVPKL